MTPRPTLERLQTLVPQQSYGYLHQLITSYSIVFKISKPRKTKLGDYRYDPKRRIHLITVNEDLNPYAFLITAIHEVAHFLQFRNNKRKRIAPHGPEWKAEFKGLMAPLLSEPIFPEEIATYLRQHMLNPKASSCSDPHLMRLLEAYNDRPILRVENLPDGTIFRVDENRTFRKEEKRRTRFRCTDIETQRTWFVHGLAEVHEILEKPLV